MTTNFVEYVRRKPALDKAAACFRKRAFEHIDMPGVQLAYLVLANYCTHVAAKANGGPSLEMIMLAESLNDVVAAMAEETAP